MRVSVGTYVSASQRVDTLRVHERVGLAVPQTAISAAAPTEHVSRTEYPSRHRRWGSQVDRADLWHRCHRQQAQLLPAREPPCGYRGLPWCQRSRSLQLFQCEGGTPQHHSYSSLTLGAIPMAVRAVRLGVRCAHDVSCRTMSIASSSMCSRKYATPAR